MGQAGQNDCAQAAPRSRNPHLALQGSSNMSSILLNLNTIGSIEDDPPGPFVIGTSNGEKKGGLLERSPLIKDDGSKVNFPAIVRSPSEGYLRPFSLTWCRGVQVYTYPLSNGDKQIACSRSTCATFMMDEQKQKLLIKRRVTTVTAERF